MFATKDKKAPARPEPVVERVPAPVIAAPVAAAAPQAPPREKVADPQPTNTISRGTSLQGNIETDANLRIEGRMRGDVKAHSLFTVGEGAMVEGNVVAESAEIAGEVRGQIEVAGTLVLKATAVVHGDIATGRFVVEAGAQFNGCCKMGASAAPLRLPAADPVRSNAPTRAAQTAGV